MGWFRSDGRFRAAPIVPLIAAMTNRLDDPRYPGDFQDIARENANAERRAQSVKTRPATEDKLSFDELPDLTDDELRRIPVLEPGSRLEQGSVYLDLDDLEAGPFRAIGSREVRSGQRYVPKRDADYEIWNRLTGDREPRDERP